ncbi:MAG: hypothetical protein ACK5EA_21915, partial [Planctomycetaceae bacterium]
MSLGSLSANGCRTVFRRLFPRHPAPPQHFRPPYRQPLGVPGRRSSYPAPRRPAGCLPSPTGSKLDASRL